MRISKTAFLTQNFYVVISNIEPRAVPKRPLLPSDTSSRVCELLAILKLKNWSMSKMFCCGNNLTAIERSVDRGRQTPILRKQYNAPPLWYDCDYTIEIVAWFMHNLCVIRCLFWFLILVFFWKYTCDDVMKIDNILSNYVL